MLIRKNGTVRKRSGLIVSLLLSLTLLVMIPHAEWTQPGDPVLLPNCGTGSTSLVANASQVLVGSSGTIIFSCGVGGDALTVTSAGSVIPQFSLPSSYSSLAISTSSTCVSAVTLTSGSTVAFGMGSGILPVASYNYCAKFLNTPSAGLASFAITWSALSPSTVGCGHDLSCSVQSNSTLSNVRFAGNTIHIEANGPQGTLGYANVTIPKPAIPNIGHLHVFVDNSKLSSSTVLVTSNSTDYFVYFTFTFHSPILVDIQLTSPENAASPNILGLDPTLFYGTVAALAVVIVVVSVVAYRTARSRSKKI